MKSISTFFILLSILLNGLTAYAQHIGYPYKHLYFHQLNTSSLIKIKHPVLHQGFVAQDGTLFVGGESGLFQIYGANINNFLHNPKLPNSICDNYIVNIIEDKYHNLWVGTQNGLAYLDRNTNTFTNYQSLKADKPIPPNFYAYPFYIDAEEQIWVYIVGHIFKLNPAQKSLTYVTTFSNSRIFVQEPFYQNTFKAVANKYTGFTELHIRDGKKVEQNVYLNTSKDSLKCVITKAKWQNDSVVWMTSNIGLIQFNTRSKKVQVFKPTHQSQKIAFTSVEFAKDFPNYLLIGCANSGLYIFNITTQTFVQHYTHDPLDANSIGSDYIIDIKTDNNNNIFFVLPNIGLSYTNILQSQFDKLFYKREVLPYHFLDNRISSLAATDSPNELIIGTATNGIVIYDIPERKIRQHFAINDGIKKIIKTPTGFYMAMSEKNDLYLLGKKGQQWSIQKCHLHPKSINHPETIFQDLVVRQNAIWMATNYGLAKVEVNNNQYLLQYDLLVNDEVEWDNFSSIISVNDTTFLLQSLNTNLYLVAQRDGYNRVVKEIARTPFQILGGTKYKDKIALSTSVGLKYYNPATQQLVHDTVIDDYCVDLVFANNNLWITTKNGLIQYQPENGSYARYAKEDGLQDNVFSSNALLYANEKIIAGGSNGFNIFRPSSIKNQIHKYAAYINSIKINDSSISFKKYLNNAKQTLILPYNSNNITLDISPLVFINNPETPVYYQLLNFDQHSITVKGQNTVTYANLQPGAYTLKVFGTLEYQTQTISIIISAPYWQALWFKLLLSFLAVTLVSSGVYLYIYINKRKQIKDLRIMISSQEKERERIARDLHDLFGARLSTLKLYMQTMNKNNPNSITTLTHSASGMIDSTISELRHLLFDLSPKSLTDEGLIVALEDLVNNLRKITKLTIHTDFITYQEQLHHKKELSIYRVLQELLNNTLKYAQANTIHISIVKNGHEVIVMYEDNGIGFDPSTIKYGYGLHNIHLHTKAMLGELSIDSQPNKGLQIIITIPIKE